jgi:hypothetical protein
MINTGDVLDRYNPNTGEFEEYKIFLFRGGVRNGLVKELSADINTVKIVENGELVSIYRLIGYTDDGISVLAPEDEIRNK